MKVVLFIIAALLFTTVTNLAKQAVIEADKFTRGFLQSVLVSGKDFSYPDAAEKLKQDRTCSCAMSLFPDGTVKGIEVTKSSGYPLIDDYVKKTLKGYRFKPDTAGPIQWFITFSPPGKVKVVALRF